MWLKEYLEFSSVTLKSFPSLEDEPGKKKVTSVLQNIYGLDYREESNKQLLKHANPYIHKEW